VSERPLANSYWVIEGRLLAGEYPLGLAFDSGGQVADLLAAGIDCFIDLTEPDECPTYDQMLPSGVEYVRRPIPDHGIPFQIAHMREIQLEIEAALAGGRRLYLHCRAGVGRTGMAAGCYLVEHGLDGDAALDELNRLWPQSARSANWTSIPQTEQQTGYVRDWVQHRRPRADAEAAGDGLNDGELGVVRSLRERFLGALMGLAVGDALAAATQYRRAGSFTPVGDLLGGGPFDLPRGGWSDDTAMALCLAESLAERERFDPRDQVNRLLRWQSQGHLSATGQCLGITAATARALAAAQWRRQPFAGSHDPAQLDPEPLSRVAPAVLHAYGSLSLAQSQAVDAARITCQAPLVLDGCRLLAAMLHAALRGESRESLLSPSAAQFAPRPLKPEVTAIIGMPLAQAPPAAAGNGNALTALHSARWALGSTDSFRSGALCAVNMGGNSDVAGAVYGQLAGAHYGVSAIPGSWRAALLHSGRIESLADRLLALALERIGTPEPTP